MLATLALAALLSSAPAQAETASTLPGGSQVLYGGLGATHSRMLQFRDDAEGRQQIDPGLRVRADLYGAAGLSDRVELSAYLPVAHGRVLDSDSRGPCPGGVGNATEPDYCDAWTTVGAPFVQARWGLLQGPLLLTPALGVGGDPWNAGLRGRLVTPSDAVVDVVPGLYLGGGTDLGGLRLDLVGKGAWAVRLGRQVDGAAGSFTAPADEIRWAGEVHLAPSPKAKVELGLHGLNRLWGADWDGAYQSTYFTSPDRWTSLWYRQVAVTAKVSLALSETMGLHVGGGRVVAVRNGPPDTLDITVGVHRYFAPRP